jgi:hypothetical protein
LAVVLLKITSKNNECIFNKILKEKYLVDLSISYSFFYDPTKAVLHLVLALQISSNPQFKVRIQSIWSLSLCGTGCPSTL